MKHVATDLTPPRAHCGCNLGLSRRDLLVAGGTALTLAGASPALSRSSKPRIIDVHHHFDANQVIPGILPAGPPIPGGWNLARDLDDMERGGVATAMLSWFSSLTGATDASRAARAINEAGARLVSDHPGRFALLANLPLPDVASSLAELVYGLETLRADGICLPTNDGARWLGDSHYEPLFAELNRRKAVVFVHPLSSSCCRNMVPGVPDTVIEFGADTTRCIASLIFNGTTTRFPDVRFIFSHGGGATMAVIERFLGGTHGKIVPGVDTQGVAFFPARQPPGGALNAIRKLHFDTAQASNPVVLGALKKALPVSQILYGTDFQFQTAEVTTRELRGAGVFNTSELGAVEHSNALRLFPRLAA